MKKPSAKEKFSFGLGLLISLIVDFFSKKVDKEYFLDGVCSDAIMESEMYHIDAEDDNHFIIELDGLISQLEDKNDGLPPLDPDDESKFDFERFRKENLE